MNAKTEITASHQNIATALAAAQMDMGKALKSASNPHFKSKYADLSSVADACLPALNMHGIAVIQPTVDDESGRYVRTILIHGSSGEQLDCRVPLIVSKNDMQGYGSAVTYARRYGLMSMAGIAPEDDDGNAASKAPPRMVSPDQYIKLRDAAEEAGVPDAKICETFGAQSLQQFPADRFDTAMNKLNATIAANAAQSPDDLNDDAIPDFEKESETA